MNWPDLYLICFVIGVLWTVVTLILGGLHFGHAGPLHGGHAHGAHIGHAQPGGHHGHIPVKGAIGHQESASTFAGMINPSSAAVFLAWFGAMGYLLTRHSGLMFWLNLAIAVGMGLGGAWILATFLRFLESREQPLDPTDYEMTGVLGRVSSQIRPDGTGEVIYTREGSRKCVAARSEDGTEIERGREVIVTRYERGIAYVRTWEAMTR